jgi:signal transduction histidine kinase
VIENKDGERVFRTMLPIKNDAACVRCHDPEQALLGELLTDISITPLEAPVAASFRANLLWSAGMILIVVISITSAMNKLVIHRLEGAVKTLKRFAKGERDVRLQLQGSDEIALLGTAFNEMAQSVESQEETNRALSNDLQRQSELRRELLKKVIVAQEEERKRVARDLHDELGQGLASITLSLDNFEHLQVSEPKEAESQIRKARGQITDMTDQMHDMIVNLRPSALDHLGLEPALRTYGRPMLEEAGVKLNLTSELKFRLPVEIESTVFRTFQEALTNIVRHAKAQRVTIRLAMRDGIFEGEVADDGRGFEIDQVDPVDSSGKGFGLLGMDERVALCGGELKILSKPGSGTRIQVYIPVPDATHA